MLSAKIETALNDQLNFELYSGYIYLAMSAQFSGESLNGFANWLEVQTMEEYTHAQRFYNFILERGGAVELLAIKKPQKKWNSLLEAFETAYDHECIVSSRINKLLSLARDQKDFATENFLQWFVKEQVEEEASVSEVVDRIRLAKKSPEAVLLLDRELGQRAFTPPAPEK